jgi:hypothetical protein
LFPCPATAPVGGFPVIAVAVPDENKGPLIVFVMQFPKSSPCATRLKYSQDSTCKNAPDNQNPHKTINAYSDEHFAWQFLITDFDDQKPSNA